MSFEHVGGEMRSAQDVGVEAWRMHRVWTKWLHVCVVDGWCDDENDNGVWIGVQGREAMVRGYGDE